VTLGEQGLSFESEIANHSPYVVETVSYPILGDLAVPAGEKSLTRENLNYGGMRRAALYPTFVNERGYYGVDYPIQMVPTPHSPFVLVATDQQGLYAGAHDTTNRELIEWTFELKPGYEDSLNEKVPGSKTISGHAVSVVFSITHFPFAAAGESAPLRGWSCGPTKGAGIRVLMPTSNGEVPGSSGPRRPPGCSKYTPGSSSISILLKMICVCATRTCRRLAATAPSTG